MSSLRWRLDLVHPVRLARAAALRRCSSHAGCTAPLSGLPTLSCGQNGGSFRNGRWLWSGGAVVKLRLAVTCRRGGRAPDKVWLTKRAAKLTTHPRCIRDVTASPAAAVHLVRAARLCFMGVYRTPPSPYYNSGRLAGKVPRMIAVTLAEIETSSPFFLFRNAVKECGLRMYRGAADSSVRFCGGGIPLGCDSEKPVTCSTSGMTVICIRR